MYVCDGDGDGRKVNGQKNGTCITEKKKSNSTSADPISIKSMCGCLFFPQNITFCALSDTLSIECLYDFAL